MPGMGCSVAFLEWGGEASLLGVPGDLWAPGASSCVGCDPRCSFLPGASLPRPTHVLGILLLCTPTLPTQTWVYLSALSRRKTKALTSLSTCHVCASGCGRSPVGPLRDRGITTHPFFWQEHFPTTTSLGWERDPVCLVLGPGPSILPSHNASSGAGP